VLDSGEEYVIVVRAGFEFRSQKDLGIKGLGVGKVVGAEDETEVAAVPGDEPACGALGVVVELFDGFEHLALGFTADASLAVEDQGDGGNRNTCSAGDISNRHIHRNALI